VSSEPRQYEPLTPPQAPEPPGSGPVQQPQHWLKRLLAPVAGVGLLIWKLLGPLLLAAKSAKLLVPSLTFIVSLAAYTGLWGWRFALGFMVLLFIHEMGHVVQLRREGIRASAPMFVPLLGAFVAMKELPHNA
jgi:Zn-dependent protease